MPLFCVLGERRTPVSTALSQQSPISLRIKKASKFKQDVSVFSQFSHYSHAECGKEDDEFLDSTGWQKSLDGLSMAQLTRSSQSTAH
jgi:hypothetical protein